MTVIAVVRCVLPSCIFVSRYVNDGVITRQRDLSSRLIHVSYVL
jgi:hypothetical protein